MSEISPTSVISFDAAAAYANETADMSIRSDLRIAFVAGAEWQWNRVGDAIAAKDAEIERLREALKPFSEMAVAYAREDDETPALAALTEGKRLHLTVGDLRRARAALNPEVSNV